MSVNVSFVGGPLDGTNRGIEHATRWFECAYDLPEIEWYMVDGIPFPRWTGIFRYSLSRTPCGYEGTPA